MPKEKFDLNKYIEWLEQDAPASTEEMYEDARYRECPRCGSDTWNKLIYSKKTGRAQKCDECEHDEEQ